MNTLGCNQAVNIESRCNLLQPIIAELRFALTLTNRCDLPYCPRDRVLRSKHGFAARHLVQNTIVVGASVPKAFYVLQNVESVTHHLVIKSFGTKLIEVDEGAKRD